MNSIVQNKNVISCQDVLKKSNNQSESRIISNEEVDYDQFITAAGEFGKYQVYLTILTFPYYIFGVFAYFGQLFMTEISPNHWCWVPELENLTNLDRRTLAIPEDTNARFGYLQCQMYVANWSEVLSTGIRPNSSWSTQLCQSGWEFNKTEIPYATITSEMGWVCDKDSYQATAQAFFFVGSVVGGFILGFLSDRYGRISGAVISNVIGCIAGITSVFANNFVQFTLCRFLMGISYDSCMMMTYLLILEFVAPKYRSIMANLPFGVFYSLGATSLPWIALTCGHWKTISLTTSLPMALALLTPLIVPESPRWLLSKGRIDEATNKVLKAAHINKKEIPAKLIVQFKASANKKETAESGTLIDLLRRPLLRKIFFCLCLQYMTFMIVFDALIRRIGGLGYDFFISFSLVSVTELPSLLLVAFILDLTGRKWLSILCLTVSSLLNVLTVFLSGGFPSVLCAIAARFLMNICGNAAMQWGAEILPTPVRGSGVGFIHICGYVASILSPYIVYLENYITWLTPVLIAIIALSSAAFALVLPETAGKNMPQTFDDAEVLVKNQKMFDIPCLQRYKKENTEGNINSSL